MDTYKIVYDESDEQGEIYGISIVEDPANLFDFVALSKEEKVLLASEKEKKVLTGVVLVPNQKILRKDNKTGELYDFYFEAETIEKLALSFFKKGYQRNSTFNHSEDKWLDGTTIYESWIVEDPNNDKSNHLGFRGLPKGTWMVSMKLSDDLWEEYIKTGKAKGFSIDSFLQFEKIESVKLSKIKKKTKMGLLQKLLKLAMNEEFTKIDVEGVGELFADSFEVNKVVFSMVESDYVPFSDRAFDFDGFSYATDANGMIISKEPIQEEAVAEEESNLTPVEMKKLKKFLLSLEEDVQEVVEVVEDLIEEAPAAEDAVALDESLKAMEAVVEELKAVVAKQEEELVELRKQPKETRLSALRAEELTNQKGLSKLAQIAKQGKKI
jgi:hypothetical protein